jgi:hypothetical protein
MEVLFAAALVVGRLLLHQEPRLDSIKAAGGGV